MDKKYPFTAPKIKCKHSIFHPNIDPDSKEIGLEILENWTAVLSLNDVIYAILLLFFEPNCKGKNKNNNLYLNNMPLNYMVNQIKGNKYKYCTNNKHSEMIRFYT